jgi:hypothetical protein
LGVGMGAEGKGLWLLLLGISSFVRGKVKKTKRTAPMKAAMK